MLKTVCQSVAWFKRYKTLKSVTVGSLNLRKFSYSARTRSAFGLARNKKKLSQVSKYGIHIARFWIQSNPESAELVNFWSSPIQIRLDWTGLWIQRIDPVHSILWRRLRRCRRGGIPGRWERHLAEHRRSTRDRSTSRRQRAAELHHREIREFHDFIDSRSRLHISKII